MKQHNIIHNLININPDRKSEIVEWMVTQLISDEAQLPEETLDEIREYLAEESDEQLKREMDLVFLAAFQSGRSASPAHPSPLVEEMWPEIAEVLGMNPNLNSYRSVPVSPSPDSKKSPLRPFRKMMLLRAAAVLLPVAMIVGGYFGWNMLQSVADDELIPAAFVATATVEAQADSVRHINLADGTMVVLNRNSTFAYNDHREGELTGEAWFNVAKDPEHPFVIRSNKLTVTVLGTEFSFSTLAGNERSAVALYSGSVRIEAKEKEYRLIPGEAFTLDHSTDVAEIHDFDIEMEPNWITAQELEERQLMNIIPLGDIFDLIEAEYGVTISGRAAVDLSREYNFIPDEMASVDEVMEALQFADGEFGYTVDGTTITLE
jgi:ferric-dicitrate binding protein FerR (iron transport regulator)